MTVDQKVKVLIGIIRQAANDKVIKNLAHNFGSYQDGMRDIKSVYDFVKTNISYINEPFGQDNFQYPTFTLRTRFGDCEDHTALLASIFKAQGHNVAIKVVKTGKNRYHVYPVVEVNGKWLPVDTTIKEPLGSEVKSRWGKMFLV